MIKAHSILISIFITFYLKISYDILIRAEWLTKVQRDIIYFFAENLFMFLMLILVLIYSQTRIEKVLSISFLVVIIVNIYLNLSCWKCEWEVFRFLVTNSWIDVLKWSVCGLATIIGIKWVLLSKHIKSG